MRHYLFVVEGAHDVAAISCILKLLGIDSEIRSKDNLSEAWEKLIPDKYPFNGDVLDRITPLPSFFQNDEVSIAIKVAGSDSKLFSTLDEIITTLNIAQIANLNGVLLFCDADDKDYSSRLNYIIKQSKDNDILSFDLDVFLKDKVIKTRIKDIKTDLYIFPDNKTKGTLEHLLLQGANIVYKDLYEAATTYVSAVDSSYKRKWSVSSENKVLVGCIANVLKPGKANQVSISDNEWIGKMTVDKCDDIKKFFNFIGDFIKL